MNLYSVKVRTTEPATTNSMTGEKYLVGGGRQVTTVVDLEAGSKEHAIGLAREQVARDGYTVESIVSVQRYDPTTGKTTEVLR